MVIKFGTYEAYCPYVKDKCKDGNNKILDDFKKVELWRNEKCIGEAVKAMKIKFICILGDLSKIDIVTLIIMVDFLSELIYAIVDFDKLSTLFRNSALYRIWVLIRTILAILILILKYYLL